MNFDQKKNNQTDDLEKFDEESGFKKNLHGWNLKLAGGIAITWSLFQLWYASPLPFILDFGKIIDIPARAIHLAFGLILCFLIYPGLKSFLKKLDEKNYKLAVCSNKLEELTKIVLKKTKLSKYFDFVAGGDTFTHRKPHPSVLNNVVKKFKINKKKALFIGDSEHDYHSAKNSNIKFCLKTKGFTNKPVSYFNKSLKIKAYTDKIIF